MTAAALKGGLFRVEPLIAGIVGSGTNGADHDPKGAEGLVGGDHVKQAYRSCRRTFTFCDSSFFCDNVNFIALLN